MTLLAVTWAVDVFISTSLCCEPLSPTDGVIVASVLRTVSSWIPDLLCCHSAVGLSQLLQIEARLVVAETDCSGGFSFTLLPLFLWTWDVSREQTGNPCSAGCEGPALCCLYMLISAAFQTGFWGHGPRWLSWGGVWVPVGPIKWCTLEHCVGIPFFCLPGVFGSGHMVDIPLLSRLLHLAGAWPAACAPQGQGKEVAHQSAVTNEWPHSWFLKILFCKSSWSNGTGKPRAVLAGFLQFAGTWLQRGKCCIAEAFRLSFRLDSQSHA